MFIQTEKTPNPETIKFIPGQVLLESGTLDFASDKQVKDVPLAQRLFAITGVKRVFLSVDFVSVTKNSDADWSKLKPLVLAALMEHLSTEHLVVNASCHSKDSEKGGDDNEIISQIKELLEDRVRPMVMMDGGDIVFDSFVDGVVYLKMQGACSGCPSATATLKIGVEKMLRHYIPEIIEVRQKQ